jgi:hypothetical protein
MNMEVAAKYAYDTSKVYEAAKGLPEMIDQAEERILKNSASFSNEDFMKMIAIQDAAERLVNFFELMPEGYEGFIYISNLDILLKDSWESYLMARSIYQANKTSLSSEDREFYEQADAAIEESYQAYISLKSSESGTSATEVLTLVLGAMKTVVKLVTIIAPLILL